jgi:hypothetical protein
MELPSSLLDEVRSGNCIAFVGAGFSAGVVPGWRKLLSRMKESLPADSPTKIRVGRLLELKSSRTLEAAAQALRDELTEERFVEELQAHLGHPETDENMRLRLHWLQGIPFRSILTTNFDGLLEGEVPGRDAYIGTLRPLDHRWWNRRFWDEEAPGPSVVKLHGDLGSDPPKRVVFTRRDYRERLYGDPAYTTFLRSVFATTAVLYLGFSFTDAYLNELRSEILALLEHQGGDRPIAYAVVNDVPDDEVAYLRRHEGIEVMTYDSSQGSDYSGFDDYLRSLYEKTNPRLALGRYLEGKRILWVDQGEWSNDYGLEFLRKAADSAGSSGYGLEQVETPQQALERLSRGPDLHLVITQWGHGLESDEIGKSCASAECLLAQMRKRDLRVPVIVFASGEHADENKAAALALGTSAFTFDWEGLFRRIADVFEPGSRSGRGSFLDA